MLSIPSVLSVSVPVSATTNWSVFVCHISSCFATRHANKCCAAIPVVMQPIVLNLLVSTIPNVSASSYSLCKPIRCFFYPLQVYSKFYLLSAGICCQCCYQVSQAHSGQLCRATSYAATSCSLPAVSLLVAATMYLWLHPLDVYSFCTP